MLSVRLAAASLDDAAEHDLLPFVVQPRVEDELAALSGPVDRPPGERTRHLGDVLLRIAAVHAERVELQQLASVVFVKSLRPLTSLSRRTRRRCGGTSERVASEATGRQLPV